MRIHQYMMDFFRGNNPADEKASVMRAGLKSNATICIGALPLLIFHTKSTFT